MNGVSAIVPARFTVPENPVGAGMGAFVPAQYVVPENPLLRALSPKPDNVVAANLTGCGSTIPGDYRGCAGLGDLISGPGDQLSLALSWVQKYWLWLLGGGAIAWFLVKGKTKPETPHVKANPRHRRRRY